MMPLMFSRLGSLAALAVPLLLVACDQQQQQAPAPPPPAVTVTPVVSKDVTPSLGLVGRVVATDRVDLRARVTGFLEQRLFEEGQEVAKGDLMFVIEKAPYEAAVSRAKADVAKAEASLAQAQASLARNQMAVKSGAISKQQLDEAIASQKVRAAEVLETEATLEKAELDLSYTDVRTPIKGEIGRETYTVGNLVTPESEPLATVVSRDPTFVIFPISGSIILEYQQEALKKGPGSAILVRLRLSDGSIYTHPGRINFSDITINRTTDTLDIRAEFPNPDDLLIDGQFVGVVVEREQTERAIVISRSAMQFDQAGRYVLVVTGDNEVERRRIEVGQEFGPEVVVTNGLKEGDRIIIHGIQRVRPGIKVQPTEAEPTKAEPAEAQSPATELEADAPEQEVEKQ